MLNIINLDPEILFLVGSTYILVAVSVSRLGMGKAGGVAKTFFLSLVFTPLTGLVYILNSPLKNLIKTVHYRCTRCGLEFTENYDFCPTCEKEGKRTRLKKIRMKSF